MIVVSTQCFPPRTGGIENLMHSLCVQLQHNGHPLRVYADAGAAAEDHEFDRSCGFPVLRFGGIKPWRRRSKARAIQAHLDDNDAVVLTDSWKSLELLETSTVKRSICLAHGTEFPLRPGTAKAARIVASLGKASAIVANSAYTAGRVAGYLGADDRIRIIHPGIRPPVTVDPETRTAVQADVAGRAPVLISLARLEPRKGLDLALGVMPALVAKYPHLLYIIAGAGSQRTRLERMVSAAALENHVMFCGMLAEPMKSAYLQAGDLFLLPGTSAGDDIEGFGMAYIEAAAHGLPAVAGRCGGAVEAVVHGQTGLVCDAGSHEELLEAVLVLLDNQERRKELGENARMRARAFFWPERIKDYEQLLFP